MTKEELDLMLKQAALSEVARRKTDYAFPATWDTAVDRDKQRYNMHLVDELKYIRDSAKFEGNEGGAHTFRRLREMVAPQDYLEKLRKK